MMFSVESVVLQVQQMSGNAYLADTINGAPATVGNGNLSVVTPASPLITAPSGNTNVPALLAATGQVDVPANTPAGSYEIKYQLCEKLNPATCKEATITVNVDAALVVATNDAIPSVNSLTGNLTAGNAFTGDTINTAPATTANATLAVKTAANPLIPGAPFPNLSTTDGVVSVPPGTPAGIYYIVYTLCEKLNPTNCKDAVITVPVAAPLIDAKDDTYTAVNGATGNTNVGNVVTGAGTGSVATPLMVQPPPWRQ